MPTYVTLKEVKKALGPRAGGRISVAQFEKLWGDMTALTECTNARLPSSRAPAASN